MSSSEGRKRMIEGDQSQEADSSADDSEVDHEQKSDHGTKKKGGFEELDRLRREKRLAMNRESARARRKRKKVLVESLEHQVEEMNQQNQQLRVSNETLRMQVNHLETELSMARSTIAMLQGGAGGAAFRGTLPPAGVASDGFASVMQEERAALQRQAALAALSGASGLTDFPADEQSARKYLQLVALAKSREAPAAAHSALAAQQARYPYGLLSGGNTVSIGNNPSTAHLSVGGMDNTGRLSASLPSAAAMQDAATASAVGAARRALMASMAAGDVKQDDKKTYDKLHGGFGKKS